MATSATWKRRVAEWKSSGLTATEFAAGRGFAPTTLKWWSSRLNRGNKQAEQAAAGVRVPTALPLARLIVRNDAGSASALPPPAPPIEIDRGTLRIRVHRGFDLDTLRQVLAVVVGPEDQR